MAEPRGIVIVGGSAAGISAAQAIAEAGHDGPITMISAEPRLPYKRTKVSKSFAAGFDVDAFAVLERGWYQRAGVDLLLGTTVTGLDLEQHRIQLDDGSTRSFGKLVLATGATPRALPMTAGAQDALFFAHDIAQIERLRAYAVTCERALVIGMGVLGTEVAEQLCRMGKQVTLAGDTAQVMTEHLNGVAATRLADVMRENGITLLFGQTIGAVDADGSRIAVELGGAVQRFDLVVCCIGLELRAELAREAGLEVRRGVVVDEQLYTSHPDVLAAGDVAEHPGGRLTHLWRHALHQGRVAGLNAAGGSERYEHVPFRVKCKVFDRYFFALQRPDPAALGAYETVEHSDGARYVCAYYREGRVAGLVMCDDEARQKEYNRAVVERWDRGTVEQTFALGR
ncbi:MAG: FAD-dependent oxidoreductase [Deltaproteobacteria bacterium]|nr:FAD-dependent oxidoreductase [Deltaproteobacteria bacterium]MBW2537304.1 FAD-dependent oxidoreductase [Deltaproteobacteria bacterium]